MSGNGQQPQREVPEWLRPLVDAARSVAPEALSRFLPPAQGGRDSAVLMLFGEGPAGPDVLLIERSSQMRSHAGQPAFPGGAVDPTDDGPVAAALREAAEETGLDPAGVEVVATLPALWLPPSGFVVYPVLGWWAVPSAVGAVDPQEVAAVVRVPVRDLVDPAKRFRVRHPSGWLGPAFAVGDLMVWGFTAGLLDRLLALGGFERPWDTTRERDLPADALRLAADTIPR
jgi:8-oxo-dGTP pyrophosphatase MutT (NUDIX family)